MSLPAIQAFQQQAFFPADIRTYQFKAVSAAQTFAGAFLDRNGAMVGSFSLSISTEAAVGFTLASIPTGAVAAIGRLSGSIFVNTGRDPITGGSTYGLDADKVWVEYANDRYAIGLVG